MDAHPDREAELRAILAEQRELRSRLEALDRRVAQWQQASLLTAAMPLPQTPDVAKRIEASIPDTKSDAPELRPSPEPVTVASAAPPPLPTRPPAVASAEPKRPPNQATPPAVEAKQPLELVLGSYWLVRIGIVVFLTGLVFVGNYVYKTYLPHLGAWGRLAMLFLAGGALGGGGWWIERRREAMKNYARVLQAGGMATIYYATYGAHFVSRLRVIESPAIGGALLLGLSAAIVWITIRLRLEGVALLTVLLSHYTAAMNPIHGFSLFSNLVLTAAAVLLMVRNGWVRVTFVGLVASYASFGFWRIFQGEDWVWGTGLDAAEFRFSRLFLLGYWLLFTVGFFLGGGARQKPVVRATCLTLNNAAFFAYTAPGWDQVFPGTFWAFSLVFGAVLVGLSWLTWKRHADDRLTVGALLAQGLALLTIGLVAKVTGFQLGVVLAVESLLLAVVARLPGSQRVVLRSAAAAAGLLALSVTLSDFDPSGSWPMAVAHSIVTLIFAGTAWAVRVPSAGAKAWRPWHWGCAFYSILMAVCGLIAVPELFDEPFPHAFAWTGGVVLLSGLQRFLRAPELAGASRLWIIPALVVALLNRHDDVVLGVGVVMIAAASALRHGLPPDTSMWWRRLGIIDLAAAFAIYLAWGLARIPADWQLTFFMGSGLILYLVGVVRTWNGLMWFGAVACGVGLGVFAGQVADDATSAADWLAPALLLITHQVGRRVVRARPARSFDEVQCLLIVLMAASAFALVTVQSPPEFVTVGWSIAGCVVLGLGFALKERPARLIGLVMLGAALVRVFARDVWSLGTGARIVSFLVLGAVLLSLGFVYTRFQEKIRQWL